MDQRRSYPRGHLERYGIVSVRQGDTVNINSVTDGETHRITDSEMVPGDQGERQADHHALVVKRKGFGTTGNKESTCMSIHGINYLLQSFPPDKFMRYKINVYLKEKQT